MRSYQPLEPPGFIHGEQSAAYNTQHTLKKVNDRTAKHIGEDKPLDSQPYFALWTAAQKWQPGWTPSTSDVLAEDWQIA